MIPVPHRPFASLVALAALVLLPAAALPSLAGDPPGAERGVVDGSFLEEFAPQGDEGTFVEVSLTRPLLELAAQVLEAQDKEIAAMVRQLSSIQARVIELDGNAARLAEVTQRFRELADRLRKEGWQPLAKVRDGGDEVHVLLLPGKKMVDGLTVMVRSSDGEIVFANIAGSIDLARLGETLKQLNVPGITPDLFASPGTGSHGEQEAPAKQGAAKDGGQEPNR